MTEFDENSGQRDRSPAYPIIPLKDALERLAQFETHFKRSAARPGNIGDAWGIKAKAYSNRITAALRYFGLLEYQGSGKERQVVISGDGRKYLRAQQEETKQAIIQKAALHPKAITKFWSLWGSDRPADAACLDELVLHNDFSEGGAREFLKVYDATISFAKLDASGKNMADLGDDDDDEERPEDDQTNDFSEKNLEQRQNRGAQKVKTMAGERELTTGLLSKDANFRLIVSGPVGVKEIERLIAKLELDKEILAEPNNEEVEED